MPVCAHCLNRWSWKQTIRQSFTLSNQMICPYCGEIQYTTRKSKNRLFYANLIILLPLPLSLLFDFTSYWLLTVFPVLFMKYQYFPNHSDILIEKEWLDG